MVALDTKHIEIENGNRVKANGASYTTGTGTHNLIRVLFRLWTAFLWGEKWISPIGRRNGEAKPGRS